MAFVINPATGAILFTEDATAYLQQGYRDPTADELDQGARREEFGGFEQQAQAQGERVLRGMTFGAVEGFGSDEDIRARAEVSEELSPVTSFAASVLPELGVAAVTGGLGGLATGAGRAAGRAAIAEGAGLVRAGLSAARAGGAAALAAESVGTGLVTAGQSAYAEGREFEDDPGRFAEDALIWGGLNFGIGAVVFGATKGGKSAKALDGAEAAAGESLDDVAKAAEFRASASSRSAAGEAAPLADEAVPTPAAPLADAVPVAPEADEFSIADLSHEQMGADTFRPGVLEGLRADEQFAATGVPKMGQASSKQGILLQKNTRGVETFLNDGSHRLQVAREKGMSHLPGEVQNEAGETIYKGQIRISKEEAAAVRQGEREAVEGGVERALNNASKSEADDLVLKAIGVAPAKEAAGFGRQRRLYINREAVYDVAEREMAKDLGGLMEDVGKVARLDKLDSVSSKVSDNLSAQRAVAYGISKDAANFAGELRAEAKAYGAASGKKGLQYAIPGQKSWQLALMDHAKEVQKATSGKGLFEALDGFKRAAQDYKLSLESGALNSANPIHHQKLIPRIDAFAQKIRANLENDGVWGKAGEMQRAYNGVISDKLLPHMRTFEEAVLQRTHKGYDGIWKTEGWETKIRELLKGTDPGNRRHVGAVLDAMDELASVRRKYGDAKLADRIEGQTAKVRRTVGLADEVADATERMKALGEIVGGVPMGGAIAGGLAGGLPGAVIGAALPGAVRGFVMGDLVSAFQRLSGATDAAAKRGVDDWIQSSRMRGQGLKGITAKLPKITLSGEAKQLRDVAVRRGVTDGMALFMGDDESPGVAFDKWRDALLDQEKFFEAIGQDYHSLQNEAPEVFMAIAGRADLARRFLIQRMPPNVAVSMANPEGYPPSRDSVEDWARYVNAVRFPARVVQNIGGATMQEIETLRTVHPRAYELAQQKVIEGMYYARQNGEQLDDNFLARVGILFPELDGVGSPVFSRELGDVVMAYNDEQKQNRAGPAGGIKAPRQQTNPMQATIQNGATFGTSG